MRPSGVVKNLAVASLCVLTAGAVSLAEDTKGKWQFGFGLSYYSTTDEIRSNADIAISNEVLGDTGLPGIVFNDERPDDNVLNTPSVNDDFKLDFNISYGLTRWLAIEVQASYLESSIGNIEVFFDDMTKLAGDGNIATGINSCGPSGNGQCYTYLPGTEFRTRNNGFVPVADITEIPIQISGIVRFRPESPFDPYIGLGVGYRFNDLNVSGDFNDASAEIESLRVSRICGGEVSYCAPMTLPDGTQGDRSQKFTPPVHPSALTVEVNDAFEWHAIAGVDYYLNEKFSVYVDARYTFTSGQVDIRSEGFHQVTFSAEDDGRLVRFEQRFYDEQVGVFPGDALYGRPYLWEDQGPLANAAFHGRCPECRGSGFFETEDKNGNGLFDSEDANSNGVLDQNEDRNGNGRLDTEDDGVLYVLPPGSADPGERLDEILCPRCVGNGPGGAHPSASTLFLHKDTEDVNFTRSLDRFLAYGVDICTTTAGIGNPACDRARVGPSSQDQFVFPAGCLSIAPPIGDRNSEGCPPPIQNITVTGADDTADELTIQGGNIGLGGFSLGVGFKFTF